MIVKGTKQLGSFKRGINLYIPKGNIVIPETGPLTDILFVTFDTNPPTDSSGNNISLALSNGAIINTTTYKNGVGAFGAVSGGVCRSSGLDIPDLSATDWTIECWVYRPTEYTSNRQAIINLAKSGTYTGFNLYYFPSDGGIIVNDGLAADIGVGVIPPQTWTHIRVTSTNGIKTLYVNGVAAQTGTQNILPGPYKVNIGNISENWFGDSFGSNIIIDDVKISYAQAQAEQVIWKVAIFGAGTASSNGEYVWDGSELNGYGKPVYRKITNSNSFISWEEGGGPSALGVWNLFDADYDDTSYQIESLSFSGSWIVANGASPAPSSALGYSQSSFISSITLQSNNESYPVPQTPFTRASGGTTSFTTTENEIGIPSINFDAGTSPNQWYVTNGDEAMFASLDLITWNIVMAGDTGFPEVTDLSYSA